MNFSMQKFSAVIVMVIVFSLFLASTVMAQTNENYYIRFNSANRNVTGDFDGKTIIEFDKAGTIHVISPDLDSATGYGMTIGGQRGRLFGEISIFTAKHDSLINKNAAILIYNEPRSAAKNFDIGETTYESISFDLKYAFLDPDNYKFIPYALVGISRDTFRVKKGGLNITEDDPKTKEVDESSISHTDVDFRGYGYKVGAGILVRFTNHLALEGLYAISRTELDRVSALGQTRDPDSRINSQVFTVSLNYYF